MAKISKPAKRRTKSISTKSNPVSKLSFVTDKRDKNGKILRGRGFDYWTATQTPKLPTPLLGGDFGADCEAGERRAEEFLRYLNRDPEVYDPALGWIVEAMIAKGCFGALEIGFFSRISRACLDHPPLRLTANQSTPPMMTEAEFEERYAAQTRAHRERMKKSA
jgi:hypothetical protein